MLWYPDEPSGAGGAILGFWTLPSISIARATTRYEPRAAGCQAYSHNTHVRSERGRLSMARCQVLPPSRLISTSEMPLLPEKATPAIEVVWLTGMELPIKGVSIRVVIRMGAGSLQPRCCQ